MRLRRNNQQGLGIVEVLLAVAVLSGMAYFLMVDKQRSTTSQVRSQFDYDVDAATNLIRQYLADVYSCTETVKGISPGVITGAAVPGVAHFGSIQGGDLPLIRRGIRNIAYDPTLVGSTFSSPDIVLLNSGDEIRPGLMINKIALTWNNVDYLIRVTFQTKDGRALKRVVNRDFLLNVKMRPTEMYECSLRIPIEHLQLGCVKLHGTWDAGKCNLDDYYLRSRNLIPVYEDEVDDFTATPTLAMDPVSCECHMNTCGADCCTPPPCGIHAYNEEPPRLIKTTDTCKLETSCWERPVGYLFRP